MSLYFISHTNLFCIVIFVHDSFVSKVVDQKWIMGYKLKTMYQILLKTFLMLTLMCKENVCHFALLGTILIMWINNMCMEGFTVHTAFHGKANSEMNTCIWFFLDLLNDTLSMFGYAL
jgi:hypothetical protein